MSTPTDRDGRPQIVLELPSALGGKRVKTVAMDSNRLDPLSQSERFFLRLLSFPQSLRGIVLQSCTCIAGGAFPASLLTSVLTPWSSVGVGVVLVGLSCGAVMGAVVANQPRLHRLAVLRTTLVLTGVILGVNL